MFRLLTDHPIAVNSLDHIYPSATAKDNNINILFNERLYSLFPGRQISVLDLGCAGGGMVRSMIDDGQIAVGLEGSDYSKKIRRAEWGVIPDNLFTCDVTYPFTLTQNGSKPYQFDVVTAWEFFEHIEMDDLDAVVENVDRHLKTGGLLIASISPLSSIGHYGIEKHRTQKDDIWWREFFIDKHNYKDRDELRRVFRGRYVHRSVYIFLLEKQ